MTNYYQELIERIARHIEEGSYEAASALIEEELKLPYVPMDTYDRLIDFREQIRGYLSREPQTRFLSSREVLDGLKRGGEKAYRVIMFLNKVNIREYLDEIQEYMLSDDSDRMIISVLFDLCHKQEVNTMLQYCDNGTWKQVRPSKLQDVSDNEVFITAMELLSQRFENENPSFTELCRQVLAEYAYLKYPEPLDKSAEVLVSEAVRYVFEAYGDRAGWQRYCGQYGVDEKAIGELF